MNILKNIVKYKLITIFNIIFLIIIKLNIINKLMDEKDKLEESSLINNTRKYSNLLLPTVGGIIGFMCAGPILGGSIGSLALLSLLKTTTTIAGSIGANKLNTLLINNSSWENILSEDELSKIKKEPILVDDINEFYKFLYNNINDKESNIYLVYKRYETIYRNKHYNNFVNNILSLNYNELIADTICFLNSLTINICKIINITNNDFNILAYQEIERYFMKDYYNYIYKIIENRTKSDTELFNKNINYIHTELGIHKCRKILDIKELFMYRMDFKIYIEMLNSLKECICSSHKLFQILQIFKLLYKDIESEFNNKNLNADILLPLVCLIIIKSKIEYLPIEIEYISIFSENYIDDGELGYVFTTLQLATNIIIDFQNLK